MYSAVAVRKKRAPIRWKLLTMDILKVEDRITFPSSYIRVPTLVVVGLSTCI